MADHWSYDIIWCYCLKLLLEELGYAKTDRFFFILLADNSCINDTLIRRIGSLTRKLNTNTQFLSVLLGVLERTLPTLEYISLYCNPVKTRSDWRYGVRGECEVYIHHPPSLPAGCHKIIGWSCLKTNAQSSSTNWCQWSSQFFLSK